MASAMQSAGQRLAGVRCVALAAALAPALFLDRPFHVDDPMFLWTGRQIAASPGDFFGFDVNWFGHRAPMPTAMMNPPLLGYYLAVVLRLFGSSAVAVHAALLVFPFAAALGTCSIARRIGADPATALLATAATPAFLVAATSAMSDSMLLACWIWAVDQWLLGVRDGRGAALLRSGLLMAAAVLAKFYGVALVPLLAAYALAARRSGPAPRWLLLFAALVLPLLALVAYERITADLYGAPHFAAAMAYSVRARSILAFLPLGSLVVGLAFAGGCLASVLGFAPLLWSRRQLALGLAAGAGAAALVAARPDLGGSSFQVPGGLGIALLAQLALLVAGGVGVLALAALDLWRRRDADAVLLALWVAGAFAFAALVNWSDSARATLPMAPALGLLVARRLAERPTRRRGAVAWAGGASLALALAVAHADARLAGSARDAAARIAERYGAGAGRLWFLGHWGFQYYLEERGGSAVDGRRSRLATGDFVAIPSNNTNVFSLPGERLRRVETLEVPGPRRLATMSAEVGAGFYSSAWGPLPFALGAVPAERYAIYEVLEPIEFPLGAKRR